MYLNQHTVGGEYLVNAHDAQQIPTTPLKVNKGSLQQHHEGHIDSSGRAFALLIQSCND